jgi:hypothetical protein
LAVPASLAMHPEQFGSRVVKISTSHSERISPGI